MKIKYFALSLLAITGLTLSSCSDDTYDVEGNPDNLIYLDLQGPVTYRCQLLSTPVGVFGMAGANIPVYIQRPGDANMSVTMASADSLIGKYNTENGTEYSVFPIDALENLQISTAYFNGKQSDTISVQVPEEYYTEFTAPTYILPVKLVNARHAKITTENDNFTYAYIIVTTSSTDDFVSISGNSTVNCGISKTPVGIFGSVNANFGTSIKTGIASDWTSTLTVDNSLIATYNTNHGTSYEQLPDNALQALTITSNVIPSGETSSSSDINVALPDDISHALDGDYLVPLRLTSTYGEGKEYQEDNDVVYIVISVKEALINDEATEILGTVQTDHDSWTCLSADVFDPDDLQDAFSTGWYGGWDFTQTRVSSGTFVVDLGAAHKISGFMYDSYVVNGMKLETSTDNSSWKEIANTEGHSANVRDSNWNNWYVFYGGVEARYVRVTLACEANSWAWNWYGNFKFNFAFDD